ESPHFQDLFLFFANMLLHYHQFMNPNESDLNDVLMPASLSDDKITARDKIQDKQIKLA
ncbi:putative protein YneK, partial [Shigella flexneri]|uniref:putative protein YneK n=1 Tax=Shigella flexneri TaxID=623 RepID=UPI0012E832B3